MHNKATARSSRPKVFYKIGALNYFTKFTEKHFYQRLFFNKSLFFNKVACLRPATLFKKRLWYRRFPVNFAKFLRIPFYTDYLQWLFLCSQILPFYLLSILILFRGGSRAAATSKMECFVIIVNYYHKALHLGCCSSPRSASVVGVFLNAALNFTMLIRTVDFFG